MKRVLVTGGAGFLGSHLCRKLLNEGADVICLDNFHTGSEQNVIEHAASSKFIKVCHDVATPTQLEVDQIYNLACPASPVHYQHDPVKTVKTSVLGAINMLEMATASGARILQASTSEVYGDPDIHPQVEGYWGRVNPVGIRACYDEGKRCAETLFFDYHRQYATDIKVVRIFNTYGPAMTADDGRVISNFVVQALRGEDITIYGDGSQTRSFCYVDDLINVIAKMMNSRKGLIGPMNIGNPVEYKIIEIAETILRLVGGRSKIVFMPLPADDPRQRCPDISLARQELDWEPTVQLEDGLTETINYFKTMMV